MKTVILASLAASALAATIDIKVGDGGLNFQPNSLTANVGDTLVFHFYSGFGSHSVVSSSFDTPCAPNTNGNVLYSGVIMGDSAGDKTFTTNLTSTSPLYLYCSVGSHCKLGMVAVVNPPSDSSQNEAAYAAAAKSVSMASAPASVGGGVVATGATSASVASTMSGSMSGMPSMMSSSGMSSTTAMSSSATAMSGTSMASTTSGGATSAASSAASAAATTKSGSERSEVGVVLAVGALLGGLVVLMV